MSRKMLKILILSAMALSALASSASSASAVTWTSNGSAAGTPFTATAPAAKLQVNSSPVVGILCQTASATGRAYGPGPNALSVKAADVTLAFSNCTAGGLPATVVCSTNTVSVFLTGATVGGVTPGLARQSTTSTTVCVITVTSLPGCTITVTSSGGAGGGLANVSYNNATFTLTVSATGQTLTASWTAACTIFATRPGSASATFGSNATPPGNLHFAVTSAYKPIFNAS